MDQPRRWVLRPGGASDVPFLRTMLYEAAFWHPEHQRPPLDQALTDPRLARYLAGWGRAGDTAVIAFGSDGQPLGAAWYRFFSSAEPGYGFVDERTPEVSIAVVAGERGRGVGTALLAALAERARADGIGALSLSVERTNPAARLYARSGYQRQRRNGNAWLMVRTLSSHEGAGLSACRAM